MRKEMKVGDLVRARLDLDDNQGFVEKGVVGIVTKQTQPTPDAAMGTAVIKFPHSTYITCLWQELEVISESR